MAASGRLPEKVLSTWSSKGKEETLTLLQNAWKQGSPSAEGNLEFRSLLYDVMRQVINGSLEADEVVAAFSELASTLGTGDSFPSLLADSLTILDAEVFCNESKEQRSAFKALTSACTDLLGEPLLKERLDMDALESGGLVLSKTNFNQKYVKTKTKLFYKQQKFNLFREENEGYSKLIAELGHERRLDVAAPAMLENIKSLIGRFNLDPNRVLDAILEAFEGHLEEYDFFLPLLEDYPCEKSTFVNILGLKFQCYQDSELDKTPPTPASLHKMAALLLRRGLVKLEDFYPHLTLGDAQLREFHERIEDEAKATAKKANIVSLTEKSDEDRDREAAALAKHTEQREMLLSLETNQKLGLCHAHLEMGDWRGAKAIMSLLPPFLPVWSPMIAQSLCRLASTAMEPLYRSTCAPRAAKGSLSTSVPENLQQCHKFTNLYPEVFEMLFSLGPHVHADPLLLAKVVRLGRAFLKEGGASRGGQDRAAVFRGFLSLLNEVVFPCLSLMPCNCGMAEEVWAMVKQLPYEIRYQMYGHWKNSSYSLHPELIEAQSQAISKGKYIMKRLTKDNVKPSGRQIGKISHSNPGVIFDYVLSQIQRYDNFIIPVVDSLKYLTSLAYDVLAYCIIEALGNPQKERLKHEDTNISNWLKGLANFCANVFKKYPIELTGLLQYVTNQLKAGKSFDLLVLKEVVQKMSGIEISEDMTSSQLEALAGGELLKAEGAYFTQVRNTKKSSQRLREALVDANLSLPLCLLMAQQRDCIIFQEGAIMHLKLVGMLLDHCLDTLVQFGGFLSTHLSPDEYSKRIPGLDTLGLEFHIPADVAFFMLRPLISNSISEKFLVLEKASKAEGDKQDKKSKASRQEANYHLAHQHVVDPVIEAARSLHPPKVWEEFSCRLYATFWTLSLYDLYVPGPRYEEEASKARNSIHALKDSQDVSSSKRKKEQERSAVLVERLQEERQRQEDNHRLVMARLKQERDSWFSAKVTKNRTITQLLQLCIFPRCHFTASDAVFCAKFVYMLHSLQTPNFSTLLFFDRIFSDISYTVASCTENEVRRYGRFLGTLLEIISRWHANESTYAEECAKTPGFISMMRSSGAGTQYLDYENYRHITFKWHFKLTKSLVVLLESKDYMQVRNGLIVLTKVLPHYPKVYHLSIALEKRIEKIMEEEKEKRQDLYALAIGYAGMLKNHKQNLVAEVEFHNREERLKSQSENEGKAAAKSQEKEGSIQEVGREIKQEKASKVKSTEEAKAISSKGKSEEKKLPPSSSREATTVSSKGGEPPTKGAAQKEEGGKAEAKSSSAAKEPKEKSSSEKEKEREKNRAEKKGEGKEGSAEAQPSLTAAGIPAELEISSTAKAAAAAKGGRSPLVRNGPVGGTPSPARAGQRRQHSGESGSPDSTSEKEVKRRKVANTVRSSKEGDSDESSDKSSSEKKDKTRKRERSSDKETSDSKRKKDLLEVPPVKEAEVKEKKRVVKVSKKEGKTVVESSLATKKTTATVKKDKEDDKAKKHHSTTKARAVKK